MKRAGGGFDYCHNGQIAIDETPHIIAAAESTNSGADSGQLPSALASAKQSIDADPRQVVADAGYRSEAVFEALTSIAPRSSLPSAAKEKRNWGSIRKSARFRPQWQKNSKRRRSRMPAGAASGYQNAERLDQTRAGLPCSNFVCRADSRRYAFPLRIGLCWNRCDGV
jgi:hypothetical protein